MEYKHKKDKKDMKYKWLSILFLWGAWAACEDDAAVFEASVPAEGITFAPVNGVLLAAEYL